MLDSDTPQSRGRRFTTLIMAGCALFCGIEFLLYLAPHFVDMSQSVNLAGPWRACFSASPRAKCDKGAVIQVPGGVRGGGPETPYLILEREGTLTHVESDTTYSLIIGTVSSSLRVFAGYGGQAPLLAEFGDFQNPGYSQALPVLTGLGRDVDPKTLRVVIAAKKLGVHGVLRGPFALTSARNGMILSASIFSEIVLIPLLSALLLLGIATWILMNWDSSALQRPGPIRSFFVFCIVAAFYCLSLTRIPREFLPETVGTVFHFILRLVMEVAHVRLIRRTLSVRSRVAVVWEQFLIGAAVFCSLAVVFDPTHLGSLIGFAFRSSSFLFLATIATGLAASIRAHGPRRMLAPLYFALLPMQTWDSLALNGWAPDVYCVRFYLGVVGGFYLLVFWTLLSGQRRRETNALVIGQKTARIVHDLRGPLGGVRAGVNALVSGHRTEQVHGLIQDSFNKIDGYLKSVLAGHLEAVDQDRCSVEELVARLRREHASWIDESKGRALTFRVQGLALRPDQVVGAGCDRLVRAVWNLVENGFFAGERAADNRVTVTVDVSEHRVEIVVADSGRGFDPETAWMVENWFGGATTTRSGYGLVFCQEVVAQAGGHLSVQNSSSGGGVVLVRLPVINQGAELVVALPDSRSRVTFGSAPHSHF